MSLGLLSAGASLLGGLFSSSASKKAAAAQTAAANRQIDLQEDIYESQKGLFNPFYEQGLNARNALNYELGLGERPTYGGNPLAVETFTETIPGVTRKQSEAERIALFNAADGDDKDQYRPWAWTPGNVTDPSSEVTRYRVDGNVFDTLDAANAYATENGTPATEYGGFTTTPGYEFRLGQGVNAIESGAASGGGLYSGATLKALNEFGQDYATNEYNNYLNRLYQMSADGQAAAGQTATAGSNFAAGASNAFANIGNAQAAGAIGQANAFNSTLGNLAGIAQYQSTKNDTSNVFSRDFWK